MNLATKDLGKYGEYLAINDLLSKSYKIIQKNWKSKTGEIDIIARKDGITVFVEVKALLKNQSFAPEDHFTDFKIKKLRKLAQTYFLLNKLEPKDYRFDLIAIEISSNDKTKYELRHYKNVIEDYI